MPPRGPRYEEQRAKRKRAFSRAKWLSVQLLLTLGGQCAECGELAFSMLTVDHVDPITWDRYALRYDARVAKYICEFVEGVRLRVLCMPCNGRFGQMAQMAARLREPGEDEDERTEENRSNGLDVDEGLPSAPF